MCESSIKLFHTLLYQKCLNGNTEYVLKVTVINNDEHDLRDFLVVESLLSNTTLTLKSIVSDNKKVMPIDLKETALIKKGYLIDPRESNLRRCCNVTLTYTLVMVNKNNCYKCLNSLIKVSEKCRTLDVSSILIDCNEVCETKCTTIIQNTNINNVTECKELEHKCCEGFDLQSPIQGGKIILDAFIKNQGGKKAKIFGLSGSSTFQWDQTLQNAITKGELEFIHITNETCGTYQAQNFSDEKKVGVVFTTRGPGIAMAVAGIASALREELAMVYLCGISPTDRFDEFQNIDLTILDKISKKVFRITKNTKCIDDITSVIDEACYTALHGTPENPSAGPVCIMVEFDFWRTWMSISCNHKFCPKPVLTGNEDDALYEIINKWNNSFLVTIRMGRGLETEMSQKLISMANEIDPATNTLRFPQLYLTSVFDSRGFTSPDASPKFLDMHGPVGNSTANGVVKYSLAPTAETITNPPTCKYDTGLVIDAGIGTLYTTLVTDVSPAAPSGKTTAASIIRLFGEKINFEGYFVNVNYVIEQLYNNRSKLLTKAPVVFPPTLPYLPANPTNVNATDSFNKEILQVYLAQNNTMGFWVARCINNFYDNPNSLIIRNNYYHITDSGTATFIAGQLLRNANPDNDGIYIQFSAIGLSLGSAAGSMHGNPKDAILYLGDGGFMNMLGNIIDLRLAAIKTGKRALLLYFNDFRYGNVALGDKALCPYEFTTITETKELMNMFDVNALFSSLSPVKFEFAVTGADVDTYIQNFKTAGPGWNVPGLYVLRMDGTTTPILRPNLQ